MHRNTHTSTEQQGSSIQTRRPNIQAKHFRFKWDARAHCHRRAGAVRKYKLMTMLVVVVPGDTLASFSNVLFRMAVCLTGKIFSTRNNRLQKWRRREYKQKNREKICHYEEATPAASAISSGRMHGRWLEYAGNDLINAPSSGKCGSQRNVCKWA